MAGLAGIILLAAATCTAGTASGGPSVGIDRTEIDFGKIARGQVAEQTLTVKNTGADVLDVSIRPSCECLTVIPEKAALKTAQKQIFKMTFDSAEYLGEVKNNYFWIDSNDPQNPHVTLVAKANVVAKGKEPPVTSPVRQNFTQKPATAVSGEKAQAMVFGSAGCKFCHRLVTELIPEFSAKHNVKLSVAYYPLDRKENYERLMVMEKNYNHPGSKIPVLFIGRDVLAGQQEIKEKLEQAILNAGNVPAAPGMSAGSTAGNMEQTVIDRFKSYTLLTIIGAGLIDGINPCAMATIVFLLSYLALVGRRRYELMLTGIFYTFGVFITYTMIGVFSFEIVNKVNTYKLISDIIRYLTSVFALVVGVLSLVDYIKVKTGRKQEIVLQLPKFLKDKIHMEVRDRVRAGTFILSSFVLGFFVALFELACTGQVYLPTIIYIVKNTHLRVTGFLYLILYNLIFILPVVIVFVFAYRGVTSEQFAKMVSKHLGMVKIATAILFFVLAFAIFISR